MYTEALLNFNTLKVQYGELAYDYHFLTLKTLSYFSSKPEFHFLESLEPTCPGPTSILYFSKDLFH